MADERASDPMDATAIGVKLGVEALKRTAPTGLGWLMTYGWGINLLIVGPAGAGKTSISDYLEFGTLEEEQRHEKTIEIRKSPVFAISVGRDAALKLRVRGTIDVPGQTGAVSHANLVRERRPHVLLIVVDGSHTVRDITQWLEPFCERLDYLLGDNVRLRKKVRGIFVALNKRDRVRRTTDYDARARAVRSCLTEGLRESLGKHATKAIPIVPTVAVQSKHDTRMLDALIRRIAKRVKR